MVITIAYSDIESHTTIELTKVVVDITTTLKDKVHNIKISISTLGVTAVCES